MLGRRLRRRPNIKPALGKRLAFAWSMSTYSGSLLAEVSDVFPFLVEYTTRQKLQGDDKARIPSI